MTFIPSARSSTFLVDPFILNGQKNAVKMHVDFGRGVASFGLYFWIQSMPCRR